MNAYAPSTPEERQDLREWMDAYAKCAFVDVIMAERAGRGEIAEFHRRIAMGYTELLIMLDELELDLAAVPRSWWR